MQCEQTLYNPHAYDYQLLIKHIFNAPIHFDPKQEIVCRGEKRFSYAQFKKRVHKLAHMLSALGVKAGDTVAVMDYDSHRYLECYFAVPMIGAVLHTINIRLSPEQILYTIDHAEDDILLVHNDFIPILEHIKGRMDVDKIVILSEDGTIAHNALPVMGEYETLLSGNADFFHFPDFNENRRAKPFTPQAQRVCPKASILHTDSLFCIL